MGGIGVRVAGVALAAAAGAAASAVGSAADGIALGLIAAALVAALHPWLSETDPADTPEGHDALLDRLGTRLEQVHDATLAGRMLGEAWSALGGRSLLVRGAGAWKDSEGRPAVGPPRDAVAVIAGLSGRVRHGQHKHVDTWLDALGEEVLFPLAQGQRLVAVAIPGPARAGNAMDDDEVVERFARLAVASLALGEAEGRAERREAMAADVDLAAAIQRSIVAHDEDRDVGSMALSGFYRPASECAGDWWAAYDLGEQGALVVVGDVTGHGLASAMVSAAAKGACDAYVAAAPKSPSPHELLSILDASVRRVGRGQFFMTCFASLLCKTSHEMKFANAGHVPPYVLRAERKPSFDALLARGNPLGAGETASIGSGKSTLASGDTVIWYTDGLVEWHNHAQEMYGDRRFQRLLRVEAKEKRTARELRDRVLEAASGFAEGAQAHDDITLVIGRIGG